MREAIWHETLHTLGGEAAVQALMNRVAASRAVDPRVQLELNQRQAQRKRWRSVIFGCGLRVGAAIGAVGLVLTVLLVAIAKSVQPGSTLFGLCAFGAVISGVVTMMVGRGLFESFVWAGRSGFRGRLRAVLLSGVVFWLLLLGLLIGIVVWIAA